MGMSGYLVGVTPSELNEILKNPDILEDSIFDEDNGNENELDLDKSWEGLFYNLTGYSLDEMDKATPPLAWVVLGDQVIDEEQDLGYGPAMYTTAEQVKELNRVLRTISRDDVYQKFDGAKMKAEGIYPEIIWDRPDALEYLLENFDSMKAFYEKAATDGHAVISYIG